MSDIAIRFDGLILAASFVLAASMYLLVALGAVLVRLSPTASRARSRQVARTASLFGLLYLTALAILVTYLTRSAPPTTGPDRLDWLTIPSLILFGAGCVMVARLGSKLA
jgi:uncharacterized membrane protein YkvI